MKNTRLMITIFYITAFFQVVVGIFHLALGENELSMYRGVCFMITGCTLTIAMMIIKVAVKTDEKELSNQINIMSNSKTVKDFLKLLKEDKVFRKTFSDSIAKNFESEYHSHRLKFFPKGKRVNGEAIKKISSTAAKNFLNRLGK